MRARLPRKTGGRRSFFEIQEQHFQHAAIDQYLWTTRAPGIAQSEDELLEPIANAIEGPALEIGCGEGNNLKRFVPQNDMIAIDYFFDKLHFAASEHEGVGFAAADAHDLPFADASFRSVFIRDTLHHVQVPSRVLGESIRVLAPGGRLILVEPNGRNPIVRLQTYLVAAEREARSSTPASIRHLLESQPVENITIEQKIPLPLRRMVLHYKIGLPSLGRRPLILRLLTALEDALGSMVPKSHWSYVVATATRQATPSALRNTDISQTPRRE